MITEIESKIPSITGLAATAALNSVENKMTNIIDLVKKTDDDAKISDIQTKHFTYSDYNKFTGEMLNAKVKK